MLSKAVSRSESEEDCEDGGRSIMTEPCLSLRSANRSSEVSLILVEFM